VAGRECTRDPGAALCTSAAHSALAHLCLFVCLTLAVVRSSLDAFAPALLLVHSASRQQVWLRWVRWAVQRHDLLRACVCVCCRLPHPAALQTGACCA
jgi:hypothetical protein